jgi:phage replication O-like protein O
MSSTPQLEDGQVRLANELYDVILAFGFSGRELKVLLAIIRKTYGFSKKVDDVAASQISEMCGVSRQHVTTALNALALRNVIVKRPGRFGSILGIQKNHKRWIPDAQSPPALNPEPMGSAVSKSSANVPPPAKSTADGVPNTFTCPESGHVPQEDMTSPETGQVASPETGHTTTNFPTTNPQQPKSCAPQANRESESRTSAGRQGRAKTGPSDDLQNRFDRFYAAYPKKKSRKVAEKAFTKPNPDEHLLADILAGIERAVNSGQWVDPQFIPHPATWLNAEGWGDEIQTEYATAELEVIRLFT